MDLTITEENATIFEKARALLNELSMSFVIQKKSLELAYFPISTNDTFNNFGRSLQGLSSIVPSWTDLDYAPGNFFDLSR